MANAFSDGVGTGGLRTTEEIKVLVMYILKVAGVPFSMQSVINVAQNGELANTFEVSNAVSVLCKDGLVQRSNDKLYSLTAKGGKTISELEYMLNPFALEEAKRRTAKEVLTERRLKENDIEIIPQDGGYLIKISMKEQEREMFGLSLRVGTLSDAQTVKERYIDDPTAVYLANIALLLGYDINEKQNDEQTAKD